MDKNDKYYSIIESIVKQHKKYHGLECLLDDIIDDVYAHSSVVISTINNENVIKSYLQKIVSASLITVPKRMNFNAHKSRSNVDNVVKASESAINTCEEQVHNNVSDNIANSTIEPQVNMDLVDRMINSIKDDDVVNNTNTIYPKTDELNGLAVQEPEEGCISSAADNSLNIEEVQSEDLISAQFVNDPEFDFAEKYATADENADFETDVSAKKLEQEDAENVYDEELIQQANSAEVQDTNSKTNEEITIDSLDDSNILLLEESTEDILVEEPSNDSDEVDALDSSASLVEKTKNIAIEVNLDDDTNGESENESIEDNNFIELDIGYSEEFLNEEQTQESGTDELLLDDNTININEDCIDADIDNECESLSIEDNNNIELNSENADDLLVEAPLDDVISEESSSVDELLLEEDTINIEDDCTDSDINNERESLLIEDNNNIELNSENTEELLVEESLDDGCSEVVSQNDVLSLDEDAPNLSEQVADINIDIARKNVLANDNEFVELNLDSSENIMPDEQNDADNNTVLSSQESLYDENEMISTEESEAYFNIELNPDLETESIDKASNEEIVENSAAVVSNQDSSFILELEEDDDTLASRQISNRSQKNVLNDLELSLPAEIGFKPSDDYGDETSALDSDIEEQSIELNETENTAGSINEYSSINEPQSGIILDELQTKESDMFELQSEDSEVLDDSINIDLDSLMNIEKSDEQSVLYGGEDDLSNHSDYYYDSITSESANNIESDSIFKHFDYESLNNCNSNVNQSDKEIIRQKLNSLIAAKPELKIADVYKLKFEQNMTIADIVSKLNVPKKDVIMAIDAIIELV